ncbi:MAG: hypothetical protein ACREXR_17295, partial [Gammaproteobacteria bacterium]
LQITRARVLAIIEMIFLKTADSFLLLDNGRKTLEIVSFRVFPQARPHRTRDPVIHRTRLSVY